MRVVFTGSIISLFLLSYVAADEISEPHGKSVVITETIREAECENALKFNDAAIFDMDTFVKTEGEMISGREHGKERKPARIQLGQNALLTAVETAIIGMCPGEYRKITVPPEEAYGDKKIKMPDGRVSGPNATIIMHVSLIQILRHTDDEKKQAFAIWDNDNNGLIDKEELGSIIDVYTQLSGHGRVGDMDDLIDEWFIAMDKNNDSYVTMDELFGMKHASFDAKATDMLQSLLKKYMSHVEPTLNTEEKRSLDEL